MSGGVCFWVLHPRWCRVATRVHYPRWNLDRRTRTRAATACRSAGRVRASTQTTASRTYCAADRAPTAVPRRSAPCRTPCGRASQSADLSVQMVPGRARCQTRCGRAWPDAHIMATVGLALAMCSSDGQAWPHALAWVAPGRGVVSPLRLASDGATEVPVDRAAARPPNVIACSRNPLHGCGPCYGKVQTSASRLWHVHTISHLRSRQVWGLDETWLTNSHFPCSFGCVRTPV